MKQGTSLNSAAHCAQRMHSEASTAEAAPIAAWVMAAL